MNAVALRRFPRAPRRAAVGAAVGAAVDVATKAAMTAAIRVAMKAALRISALVALAAMVACAPARQVLHYDATSSESGSVWPAPQTLEVPRYRYVGQLTGEGNFRPEGAGTGASGRSTLQRVWAAIAGLDEQAATPVVLQRPQSGMVDARGRILVTDVSRNAVFVFDEGAGRLEVWDDAGDRRRFAAPIGLAAGRDGEVLVADAELHRIVRLSAEGRPLGSFGADTLKRPTGLVRDAQRQRIYVADTHDHAIKVFDDDGVLLERWGTRGDAPGELNYPTHLGLGEGRLYVSDSLNARVQAFDLAGRVQGQIGQRGLYVGNLVRPKGVAADAEGNVYVVESMHDTLLVFDRESRLLMSIGGTGQEVGKFYLPAGVWTDGRDRVYVADMYNGRVVVFQFLGGG